MIPKLAPISHNALTLRLAPDAPLSLRSRAVCNFAATASELVTLAQDSAGVEF